MPVTYMDRNAMEQALFNLLENAVKFSGNHRKAALTAKRYKDSIIIQVKDKGIGIEKEEKDKIFEKFYRGNGAIEHSIKGTGLGLALVKHAVEAHKGHIDVESEPGWSTVFRIQLPISENKQGGKRGKKNSRY
jgi:signal transduction histidine kinase